MEGTIVLGLRQLFGTRPEKAAGRRLYAAAVAQARHPDFYAEWGVPDTPTGRFDLIVLHVFLVMHRLKGDAAGRPLAQGLCDAVVEDMDRTCGRWAPGTFGRQGEAPDGGLLRPARRLRGGLAGGR